MEIDLCNIYIIRKSDCHKARQMRQATTGTCSTMIQVKTAPANIYPVGKPAKKEQSVG